MVEADSHLKLISTSTLHTYKEFEHIDMLVHWHTVRALHYTVIPILIGSYFEVLLCHLWSQNDVIMSLLRLAAISNCFPHPYYTYTKCLSTLICCPLAYTYSKSLTQLYRSYSGVLGHLWCGVNMMSTRCGWGWGSPQPILLGSYFVVLCHLWSQHDVIMSWLRLTATSNWFPHHITHTQSVWAPRYAVHWHTAAA
jgi:hypothetical protein